MYDLINTVILLTNALFVLVVVLWVVWVLRRKPKRERVAVYLSLALFVICLTQDAFYLDTANPRDWAFGLGLLVFGWIALFLGVFAWLANPALLLAYGFMLTKKNGPAAIASLLSVIFALSFLLHRRIISSSSMTPYRVTGYGIGYWLWLASAIIMVLGSFYLLYVSRREASTADFPEKMRPADAGEQGQSPDLSDADTQ